MRKIILYIEKIECKERSWPRGIVFPIFKELKFYKNNIEDEEIEESLKDIDESSK